MGDFLTTKSPYFSREFLILSVLYFHNNFTYPDPFLYSESYGPNKQISFISSWTGLFFFFLFFFFKGSHL